MSGRSTTTGRNSARLSLAAGVWTERDMAGSVHRQPSFVRRARRHSFGMKALVLSGGTGTRLRPFTYAMPKQLIPVAGKPVLRHVLENLRELGVTDIGIVVDARDRRIAAALGDGADLGVRLTFLHQEQPLGLAHCVVLGRDFLGAENFVLHLGDNVLPEGIGALAARFAARRPAAQLVVQKVPDPRRFGVAELDADGAVLRVTEKPDRPRSDLALVGVYFFTAEVHRAVAAIAPGRRGELEITDAVQWLIDAGAEVRAGSTAATGATSGAPRTCSPATAGSWRASGPRWRAAWTPRVGSPGPS